MFQLLDERPVPWVLLENVSFMLQLDRGRALATLVEAFEARGYRWAYRVVNSLDTHAHGFYWTEGIRGLGWAQDAIPTMKNG